MTKAKPTKTQQTRSQSSERATWLWELLHAISIPKSLSKNKFLDSPLVSQYRAQNPGSDNYTAEFLIGRVLEFYLEMYWHEQRPIEANKAAWKEAMCIKAFFFQRHEAVQPAYDKPLNAKTVAARLSDELFLKKLIAEQIILAPSVAAEFDAIRIAMDVKIGDWIGEKSVYSLRDRGSKRFETWLELRGALKSSQSVMTLTVDESDKTAQASKATYQVDASQKTDASSNGISQPLMHLAVYQDLLEYLYPQLTTYVPPVISYQAPEVAEFNASTPELTALLQSCRTLAITGSTGAGKFTFARRVLVPAARQLGLTPIIVSLREYADAARSTDLSLPRFVVNRVSGARYLTLDSIEKFSRELAEALRDDQVLWILFGYDQLMESEVLRVEQKIEQLGRFALITRQSSSSLYRKIDATIQIGPIASSDVLSFVETHYSSEDRARLERWLQINPEMSELVERGMFLPVVARAISESSQEYDLEFVLDRVITKLAARSQIRNGAGVDLSQSALAALGDLAQVSLRPVNRVRDPQYVTTDEVLLAWRRNAEEADSTFIDFINLTGLLVRTGDRWQFCSDLIREELLAQWMDAAGITLTAFGLHPQFERVFALWASRLLRNEQHRRVASVLDEFINTENDPFGARWSTIARILAQHQPADRDILHEQRDMTRQALLKLWADTTSNNMKNRVRDYLQQIREKDLPPVITDDIETVLPNIEAGISTSYDPRQVLSRAGYSNLAELPTLRTALLSNDEEIVRAAAIHITQLDLKPARWEKLKRNTLIEQLVDLAEIRPGTTYPLPEEHRQARLAQSAALAILAQPRVLTNNDLRRYMRPGVIHTLMAVCNLRLQVNNDTVVLITSDGRELRSD